MRNWLAGSRGWLLAGALLAAVGGACADEDAESQDPSGQTPSATSGNTAKFHVVLGGGPHAGTYDVASEACMAGIQKPGSWHATWESERPAKGKLSAVLVGFDPSPTFGNGVTTVVNFGDEETKLLYEVQKATPSITDRGATATLVFAGTARTVNYDNGEFGEGGVVTITVECTKVTRP